MQNSGGTTKEVEGGRTRAKYISKGGKLCTYVMIFERERAVYFNQKGGGE